MHDHCVVVLGFESIVKKSLAVFLALCLSAIPSLAEKKTDIVPPGNWGAVESLTQGTEISVRMTFGDRMDGKFLRLDSQNIYLTLNKEEKFFPRDDIAEVWQSRVPDRKLNGTLIGAGAGLLAGLVAAGATGAEFSGEDALGGAFVIVGMGLGAIIGAVTDSVIKGDRLLYRAK